jgi:hypothetical protein
MFGQFVPEWLGVVPLPDESEGAVVAVGAVVAAAGVGVAEFVCAKLTAPLASSAPATSATVAAALIAHVRSFPI